MIDRYGKGGETMLRRRGAGRVTMAAAREDTTRKGRSGGKRRHDSTHGQHYKRAKRRRP